MKQIKLLEKEKLALTYNFRSSKICVYVYPIATDVDKYFNALAQFEINDLSTLNSTIREFLKSDLYSSYKLATELLEAHKCLLVQSKYRYFIYYVYAQADFDKVNKNYGSTAKLRLKFDSKNQKQFYDSIIKLLK